MPHEDDVESQDLRELDLIKLNCFRFLLRMESGARPPKEVRTFQPGDRVLVLDARVVKNMKLPRFVPRFKGPYVVAQQTCKYEYILISANRRRLKNPIHVSRIKPYLM